MKIPDVSNDGYEKRRFVFQRVRLSRESHECGERVICKDASAFTTTSANLPHKIFLNSMSHSMKHGLPKFF